MYREILNDRLPAVRERVAAAAERSGRRADDVRLLAVVKGHPVDAAHAALEAGLTDLAENRVEALAERVPALGREVCRWHMVGHLQRRKAGDVFGLAHWLHSVDSMRLAHRLDRVAPEGAPPLAVLVQVNVAREEAKYGFSPEEAAERVQEVHELDALEVRGLMTMAPLTEDDRVLRDAFGGLRRIRDEVRRTTGIDARELSMGMSNDYEIAVEEGSTMIRLGTALFGERSG